MKNRMLILKWGYRNSLKNYITRNWLLLFELFILVSICILHAVTAGHYADFYPINGTFQNYNPVRRLLNGQIPYKDFSDYLGMGHLYLGSMATFFFGGSYRSSLMAFSFLTFSGLACLSIIICKSIFYKWTSAIGLTNFILLMVITQPLFFVNVLGLNGNIISALNYALGVGNSARFVRGLILPVSVAIFGIFFSFLQKNKQKYAKSKWFGYFAPIGAGVIAGFSFIWSNDYGIGCFVCICIMTFFMVLFRTRSFLVALRYTVAEAAVSVVSIFVFAEIFTLGHFRNWAQNTFGTGGYQSWYYNSSKSYYLYDVDFSYIMLIQAFVVIAYLVFLFRKKCSPESFYRYGIPCFANMVCFCAVNEYRLLSGGDSREVALVTLLFTIVYEGAGLFSGLISSKSGNGLRKPFLLVMSVACIAWICSTAKDEMIFKYISVKDGKNVESMGGNMTGLYQDLESASDFLNGENFFATYASGQEVYENKFQPSGTDYIIHVLGDKQREDYLEAFHKDDFRYVATIKKSYTQWEYWAERANWFFYRELYRDWHPVFANSYELYWERNEEQDAYTLTDNISFNIERIDDATVKLVVKTDEDVNGFADVYIDYSVDKRPETRLANLLIQRNLKVVNTGILTTDDIYYESNFLREKSAEYIPMPVINGYGELTLTASPERCVTLNLNEAECSSIFTSFYTFTE